MRLKRRTLYFAYGSNLHLRGMHQRCPNARVVGTAKLDNWKLVFRGVADIERATGAVVWGGLWSCTSQDMAALDRYEGVAGGFYERKTVKVLTARGAVSAIVYVMRERGRERIGPPSQLYLSSIVAGYHAFHLPTTELMKALDEVEEEMFKLGAVGYVPDGRKRMKPVFEDDLQHEAEETDEVPVCPDCEILCEWDTVEDEWFCPDCGWVVLSPGMSPATAAQHLARHEETLQAIRTGRRTDGQA